MAKRERVVITGLGIVSPLGIGIKKYWDNFISNRLFSTKINLSKIKEFKSKRAFQIQDFDFYKYFSYLKSQYIARSTKFLLVAVKTGLRDAGLETGDYYKSEDIGAFTSTVYGSLRENLGFYGKVLLKGPGSVDPMEFPPALINYPSSYLCIVNNFSGPNLTFSGGFSGGLEAVSFAAGLIGQGSIKAAVVNGVNDLFVEDLAYFALKGLLYGSRGQNNAGIFDEGRNGFIYGENASCVICERLKDAKKRKAKFYAELSGYGINFGKTADDYTAVIDAAICNSGLSAKDIDLCMLNANGVKHADSNELTAVKRIFKHDISKLGIIAVKENNGECTGASGILQLLTGAKAISSNAIPSYLYASNIKNRAKVLEGINISGRLIKRQINCALINSFNLDGNNSALIIKRIPR